MGTCEGCTSIRSPQTQTIVVEDKLDDFFSTPGQQKLKTFFRHVNGLLNEKGGVIVIHCDNMHLLEKFDHKVDNKLVNMIPDGALYHERFERSYRDEKHLVYRIKASRADRPYSFLDFNSNDSTNQGREALTHTQMSSLIEKTCADVDDSDTSDSDETFVFKHKDEAKIKRNGRTEPFQESVHLQAKSLVKGKSFGKKVWENVKEYIPMFAKVCRGGSVFIGVEEEEEEINGEKKKTGVFLTNAIPVPKDSREGLAAYILQKCGELKWIGKDEPRELIKVKFHDVETTESPGDFCVIEIKCEYFHGLCFHDKEGPELYRCWFNSSELKLLPERIQFSDWIHRFRPGASTQLKVQNLNTT